LNNQSTNTAILLFTHDAETESKRKFFLNSNKSNRTIAEKLIATSVKKIQASGLPHYVFSTEQQIGFSFGERLSNAIESVFNKGYKKVIVVGNDCPVLNKRELQEARQLLESNEMVVGPTTKGGSYLIGISESSYNKDSFTNLKWGTKNLLDDLLCYAKSNSTSYCTTKHLSDINNYDELQEFANKYSYVSATARLFSSLLSFQKIKLSLNYFFIRISIVRFLFGISAPPAVCC